VVEENLEFEIANLLIHYGAKVKDKIQIPPICWAAENRIGRSFRFFNKT
jgi:hypothetical protein